MEAKTIDLWTKEIPFSLQQTSSLWQCSYLLPCRYLKYRLAQYPVDKHYQIKF